jgi:hypothetical protein
MGRLDTDHFWLDCASDGFVPAFLAVRPRHRGAPSEDQLVSLVTGKPPISDEISALQTVLAIGRPHDDRAVGDEHGWRLGRIVDPFGHEWEIGVPLRT